jgi:hypothetical protein
MKTIEVLSAAAIKDGMSKGEWSKHIRAFCTVTTTGDNVVAACGTGSSNVDDLLPMQTANIYAIINSVNNTYGQGYDPLMVDKMYKMLLGLAHEAKLYPHEQNAIHELLKQCKI